MRTLEPALDAIMTAMRQAKPLPADIKLAPTLAQRVFQLREIRNMTVKDLSKYCRFSIRRIEDIEAGLETWLSTSDRQLLAKALIVEPAILQEVESRPQLDMSLEKELRLRQLSESILEGERSLECPDCGYSLRCSVQEGLDIEGKPIMFAKAFCLRCPFVLR